MPEAALTFNSQAFTTPAKYHLSVLLPTNGNEIALPGGTKVLIDPEGDSIQHIGYANGATVTKTKNNEGLTTIFKGEDGTWLMSKNSGLWFTVD
ncbi:MAG TPA: hypothetical protein V6D17_01835 [Candidatus Obscuribacterales bacterium]